MEDKIFICGEYDATKCTVINLQAVMTPETDLRKNWRDGLKIKIGLKFYVLTERTLCKKTGMILYSLSLLADPPPLAM